MASTRIQQAIVNQGVISGQTVVTPKGQVILQRNAGTQTDGVIVQVVLQGGNNFLGLVNSSNPDLVQTSGATIQGGDQQYVVSQGASTGQTMVVSAGFQVTEAAIAGQQVVTSTAPGQTLDGQTIIVASGTQRQPMMVNATQGENGQLIGSGTESGRQFLLEPQQGGQAAKMLIMLPNQPKMVLSDGQQQASGNKYILPKQVGGQQVSATAATTMFKIPMQSVKNVKSADNIGFKCEECNRILNSERLLKYHRKTYHENLCTEIPIKLENNNAFRCKFCNRNFKKENGLQNHILKIHPNNFCETDIQYVQNDIKCDGQESIISEFECKICGKKFAQKRYVKLHIETHTNNFIHKCKICNKDFKSKVTLVIHFKKKHAIGQDMHTFTNDQILSNVSDKFNIEINTDRIAVNKNDNKHVCPTCHKTFANRSMLQKHKIKDHRELFKNRINCIFPECRKYFTNLSQVRLHLQSAEKNGGHSCTLEREENSFSNIKEFNKWKEDIEESDNARYITKRRDSKEIKDGSYKKTFFCNRSGKYCSKETRNRRLKSQGSVKIGGYCPSTIQIVCNSDGSVHSKYYKTHLGHKTTNFSDLLKLPIHARDKQFIKEKISQGIESERILEDLKKKGGRSAFIQPRDIRNILKKKEKGDKDLHLGGQQLHSDTDNEAKNTVENYELKSNIPDICTIQNNKVFFSLSTKCNKIIMCKICDKDFEKKYMLTKHMKKTHFIEPTKQ